MSSAAVRPGPSNPKPMTTVPLSAVVTEAVRRWYLETHKEAVKGDVVTTCSCQPVLAPGLLH